MLAVPFARGQSPVGSAYSKPLAILVGPVGLVLIIADRFRGTCYRAANWIFVGQTAGRGRMDREHQKHGQAIKDIYIYPLVHDVRQRLCSDSSR